MNKAIFGLVMAIFMLAGIYLTQPRAELTAEEPRVPIAEGSGAARDAESSTNLSSRETAPKVDKKRGNEQNATGASEVREEFLTERIPSRWQQDFPRSDRDEWSYSVQPRVSQLIANSAHSVQFHISSIDCRRKGCVVEATGYGIDAPQKWQDIARYLSEQLPNDVGVFSSDSSGLTEPYILTIKLHRK